MKLNDNPTQFSSLKQKVDTTVVIKILQAQILKFDQSVTPSQTNQCGEHQKLKLIKQFKLRLEF